MPKVGKVGKFRKTAAASKAASADSAMDVDSAAKKNPSRDLAKAASKNPKNEVVLPDPTSETQEQENPSNTKNDTALSRGQRRRQAKREQYLKKEKMILSTLQLKKQEDQRKRIDGLDALKEALMSSVKGDATKKETTTSDANTSVTTNKAKQKLVGSEINRMGLVLQHPAFQKDPFEAIQAHLKNTLAAQGVANEKAAIQHTFDRQQAKEKRKEDKKERLRSFAKKKGKSKFKATRSRGKA